MKDIIKRILDVVIVLISLFGFFIAHMLAYESNKSYCSYTDKYCESTFDTLGYAMTMVLSVAAIFIIATILQITVVYILYGRLELPPVAKKVFSGVLNQ